MKPRLFLGNFDFEHRLAEPTREPSRQMKRFYAQLVTAWLSIADAGDWIWTPESLDDEFFDHAVQSGLPRVIPATRLVDVPRDVECIPWGWSPEVYRLVDRYGWQAHCPAEAAVKAANSRKTSFEMEQRGQVGLEGACSVETQAALQRAIQSLPAGQDRWVVKAEFSMSARERILGRGPLEPSQENWVSRRLDQQGVVFFEPWVDRIDEVGIQIEIPSHDAPQLIGLTPMFVDSRGQYAGSWFAYQESRFESVRTEWNAAVTTALDAAKALQSNGYFGPLGVDAMIYRDMAGTRRLRPLQDINARWTMGRLSLGWRKLLAPEEEGYWRVGGVDEGLVGGEERATRTVVTSPRTVGGEPCAQVSQLVIRSR